MQCGHRGRNLHAGNVGAVEREEKTSLLGTAVKRIDSEERAGQRAHGRIMSPLTHIPPVPSLQVLNSKHRHEPLPLPSIHIWFAPDSDAHNTHATETLTPCPHLTHVHNSKPPIRTRSTAHTCTGAAMAASCFCITGDHCCCCYCCCLHQSSAPPGPS